MQSSSKNKEALRRELAQLTESFEESGGTVRKIERGVSSYTHNDFRPDQFHFIPSEQQSRTDLTSLIKTIDARKKKTSKPSRQKPQKKLIYDDFGEPLRWVWVE